MPAEMGKRGRLLTPLALLGLMVAVVAMVVGLTTVQGQGSGQVDWVREVGTSGQDWGQGISVDTTGAYVAGDTEGTLPGQTSAGARDTFVAKYDASGNRVWVRQFGTDTNDGGDAVSADSTGVYVAGSTLGAFPGQTNAGSVDAFVARLSIIIDTPTATPTHTPTPTNTPTPTDTPTPTPTPTVTNTPTITPTPVFPFFSDRICQNLWAFAPMLAQLVCPPPAQGSPTPSPTPTPTPVLPVLPDEFCELLWTIAPQIAARLCPPPN